MRHAFSILTGIMTLFVEFHCNGVATVEDTEDCNVHRVPKKGRHQTHGRNSVIS